MMNRFQACAALAYADGHFGPLANSETWRREVDELGDGLFRYLMLELSTREDCETWPEAMKRVDDAIHNLEKVLAAMQEARKRELVEVKPFFPAHDRAAE